MMDDRPNLPQPDLTPRQQVFLGWGQVLNGWDAPPEYRQLSSGRSDSIGIVGPPRYGKSSGLVVPAILLWDGPLVCTSTRGDLLAATGDRRSALAARNGGRVYVYDPFGSEYPDRSIRWSPLAGCTDPAVCYRQAATMTAVSGRNMTDGDHWRSGAAGILRGFLHAAALENLPMSKVRSWLMTQDVRDAVAILRHHQTPGVIWADDLDALQGVGWRERGSFYTTARNAMEALSEPTVLESCSRNDLDIDEFLDSGSSLFIIGPSHQQATVAPLLTGLVNSIAQRAAERAAAAGGRLDPPLLLALDEVANIAPLPTLPMLVSEGGGRGIITMWVAQSLAQMRLRYGVEGQASILTATTAKIFYGGMSNGQDLRDISSWVGEQELPQPTDAPATDRLFDPDPVDVRERLWRPDIVRPTETSLLPVSAIQLLPPFKAWLFHRSNPPQYVETPPALTIPEFGEIGGYS